MTLNETALGMNAFKCHLAIRAEIRRQCAMKDRSVSSPLSWSRTFAKLHRTRIQSSGVINRTVAPSVNDCSSPGVLAPGQSLLFIWTNLDELLILMRR